MPATSVKLREDDKRKLERLRALATLKTSKKITQEELLSKLIVDALSQSDKFVDRAFEDTVPMTDEKFEKLLSLSKDWGVETSWEQIDEAVYGSNLASIPKKRGLARKERKRPR
jgi:hypothetical protein